MMAEKSTKRKNTIGKYVIQRQIAKGSVANIYLAKQDFLGRQLIIKELLPLYSSNEKIISRFQREAKVVSQLSHDAIVHVYDYWVEGNSYYIAMEYVQGQNLREMLASVHHVPVHIAAIIIYQICRGLHHAHTQGVVHRDLKPANIIISNTGQVKILDFGIAHFQFDENLTSLGSVIGTYHYMSPEQALGKKVTPASDIFSLGILFYELLTGIKPFVKDEKGDILEKIVQHKARSPGKLNPAIPPRFNRLIRKCFRKKPRRRFQDLGKIKSRLEKYLRRYPLDHQLILKNYIERMTPAKTGDHWPPRLGRRIGYRLTHFRIRTYVMLILFIIIAAYTEYQLMSENMGLEKQWKSVEKFSRSLWNQIFPSKSKPSFSLPESVKTEPDTTQTLNLNENVISEE